MGSATGPTRTPSSSSYKSRTWYAYIEWSISYPSATTATISATLYFRGAKGNWGQVGKYVSGAISIGGSQVASFSAGSQSWQFSNITSKQVLTGSKTITRTTAAQNIAVSGWVNIASASAYDSSAGASTASGTQSVSAKTSYTISYNGNGATGGSVSGQTKWYGTNLTLRSNGYTRTGYTFSKWNTAANGSGTSYSAGGTYSANAAATLYAIWNENTATLSFNANGHGTAPSSQTMRYTQAARAPDMSAVSGYTFMGWNTQSDGSGVGYIAGSTVKQANVIPANTILYAQWKLNFPIKAKVNNAWINGIPRVKVNGVWKEVESAYLKVGNQWKNVAYKVNDNLLLGSKMDDRSTFVTASDADFSKPLRWYNGDASIHNFQLIGDGIYKDTVTLNSVSNLGIAFARLASDINLDPNSYYTLSCYASCTQSGAHLDIGLSYYTTANTWIWRGGSNAQYFNAANTIQRFALTFKPDADTKAIMYCFTVVGTNGGTNTFTIYNCKLEKGAIVTDWIPASEEL